MTSSINHPWGISKKIREKMGSTWADMDFEINQRLSQHNMREAMFDQHVGNLYISNMNIKLKYKDLLSIGKYIKKQVNNSYRATIEEKFPVDIKSHTFLLNKNEIDRLDETIHITIKALTRKYELGLYL
tara:strand:+ start:4557 stop:4943 length:387 start_codon:yes stop_codon:yes gene_type:complete